jgi:hypothetical protein
MAKTTAPATFGGANAVIVEPGEYIVSDPARSRLCDIPAMLANRRLAVNFWWRR